MIVRSVVVQLLSVVGDLLPIVELLAGSAVVPICGLIAGGFMGGALQATTRVQVGPWLFVSSALAIVVLLFAWWASHLYRAPSSELSPV